MPDSQTLALKLDDCLLFETYSTLSMGDDIEVRLHSETDREGDIYFSVPWVFLEEGIIEAEPADGEHPKDVLDERGRSAFQRLKDSIEYSEILGLRDEFSFDSTNSSTERATFSATLVNTNKN